MASEIESDERPQREGVAERLLEISRLCAEHLTDEERNRDYDAELYDELGLPR